LLPTRSELESIGNMGTIIDSFPRVQLLTTTRALPPLGLCHIRPDKRENVPARRIRRGESLDEVGFGNLQTLNPVIRILGTIWLYDSTSRILFSSDFFANDLLEEEEQPIIRRSARGLPDSITLRRSILAKFDWLGRAETTELRAQWSKMFGDLKPVTLSPSLGRVQQGEDLVQHVIELYRPVRQQALLALIERQRREHWPSRRTCQPGGQRDITGSVREQERLSRRHSQSPGRRQSHHQ
jgi:flavorubredoxin